MKVVIDINVFLVSISSRSRYHPVFNCLINGKYNLILSNDILTEYREIIEREMGESVSFHVSEALLKLPSVLLISPSYFWNLMTNDPDDNKCGCSDQW